MNNNNAQPNAVQKANALAVPQANAVAVPQANALAVPQANALVQAPVVQAPVVQAPVVQTPVNTTPFHLEVLEVPYCNNDNLIIFSRAHMSYINQIFGDETIREIIQEVFAVPGKLVIEPVGEEFEFSVHHVYYADENEEPDSELTEEELAARGDEFASTKICSITYGYQDITVDINDTLCQTYSLMALLDVSFDETPSAEATRAQKFTKHQAMINMYRDIIDFAPFKYKLAAIMKNSKNKKIWVDTVDEDHPFFINQRYKTVDKLIETMKRVLAIWESYGWQYFVEQGKCEKVKKDGGKRKTRRNRKSVY